MVQWFISFLSGWFQSVLTGMGREIVSVVPHMWVASGFGSVSSPVQDLHETIGEIMLQF